MADVFMSYVRKDEALAEPVARGLEAAGYSVWWDRHIHGGADFADEIERQITGAKAVVVLWSRASKASKWVRDEAAFARDASKLIPLQVDAGEPPFGFRQVQSIDFQHWHGDASASAFVELVESLRHFTGEQSVAGMPVVRTPAPARIRWASRQRWLAASVAAIVGAAAVFFLPPPLGLQTSTDAHNGRIEVGAFEPLTKSNELDRVAKGTAGTMVRVLATNGIRTVASNQAEPGSGGASKVAAEFVLRGRVDRDVDDLVASADIVNRSDGLTLWSITQKHEGAQSGILQEQFSVAVADVLRCGLTYRKYSNDDVSTDLLAAFLRLCEAGRDGPVEQTPELARRIVEIAPEHAHSYVLQATTNAVLSNPLLSGSKRKPEAELERLRKIVYDSARRAVEIDPSFDSALARAIVDDPAVGLLARDELLRKAIMQPGSGYALVVYAWMLETVGRIHDAHINMERAVNENPLDMRARNESAYLAAWLGDVNRARREWDAMRGQQVADADIDQIRFVVELERGDQTVAKQLRERLRLTGRLEDCFEAYADAVLAHVQLSEADLDAACPHGAPWEHGTFGHLDAAFRQIEARLVDVRDPISLENRYLFDPTMQLVRADPRFMPLAARLGLVDYWLETDQWPDFCATEKLPYDCKQAALAVRAADAAK